MPSRRTFLKDASALGVGLLLAGCAPGEPVARDSGPIIDVHMHAYADGPGLAKQGRTEQSHRDATLAVMKKLNIVRGFVSATSGGVIGESSYELLARWKAADPDRIVASMGFDVEGSQPKLEGLRKAIREGRIGALGEIVTQYDGVAPADPRLEPYWALAEELDVPVGIHMGLGPPGLGKTGTSRYRMALSNPLLLEEVLARHPRLRVWVMHAAWPMLDEMIGLLYVYPQVYVDIGVTAWVTEREEFHFFLRRLVNAGFGDRIMFGSDQMEDPANIELAVNVIQNAPFLTPELKRLIFYENAARFFRITK